LRIFVAGATGAIGRPLVDRLVREGHDVTGTTRSPERAQRLEAAGAHAVVVDAFDHTALRQAVLDARPEVLIPQLTALSEPLNPRKYGAWLTTTNRLRREVVPVLVDAARDAGAHRVIAQSVCFLIAPEGPPVVDESARLWDDMQDQAADAVHALAAMEDAVIGAPGLDGIVLRFGFFYGPGGQGPVELRKRGLPIVGAGTGRSSFIHVEDAVDATMAALDRGATGFYNVCDDSPAEQREWVPEMARLVGAKKPRRLPRWLVRVVTGPAVVHFATTLRGCSNAKARRELGWTPAHPEWRSGFAEVFAEGS
jgi:nucleoside-diphosphate-sugar epimerase